MSIHPSGWFESLFASPAQIRLLRVLARDPARSWTEREAGLAAGLPPSTAHLVFGRLLALGVLDVRRVGRSYVVRLPPDRELTKRLRLMFELEAGTLEEVLEAAAKNAPQGSALYVFGSTARGAAKHDSDVDLLLVARDQPAANAGAARIHRATRRVMPVRVQVLALGRREARRPDHRTLLETVRRAGRPLTKARLGDVMV